MLPIATAASSSMPSSQLPPYMHHEIEEPCAKDKGEALREAMLGPLKHKSKL